MSLINPATRSAPDMVCAVLKAKHLPSKFGGNGGEGLNQRSQFRQLVASGLPQVEHLSPWDSQ